MAVHKSPTTKPLTARQDRFCQEYLVDLNATQAAIRCGYAKATANREGTRLLSNAVIKKRIVALQAEQAASTGLRSEDTVRELARIAFLSEAALRKGKVYTGRDKLKALEDLGKHQGIFQADNAQKQSVIVIAPKPRETK